MEKRSDQNYDTKYQDQNIYQCKLSLNLLYYVCINVHIISYNI
jgi:hypothetical protein